MYMGEQLVHILTGPVRSGKTTALISILETVQKNGGILTPVTAGKRVFMNVENGACFPMEATNEETAVFRVGRFCFSKAGFEKASAIIRSAVPVTGWLVIDEIGPLELNGEGFSDVLNGVLALRKEKILLVVREGLAEKVGDHFGIFNSTVIGIADLEHLFLKK